jgi:HSP20 family protein
MTLNHPFDDAGQGWPGDSKDSSTWMPPADICETRNELVVTTDLPGADPKSIVVRVENSVLTIRGDRRFDEMREERHFHRVERSNGTFARSFTLPTPVDADKVVASYKDGVLRILLPKSEQVGPKLIQFVGTA